MNIQGCIVWLFVLISTQGDGCGICLNWKMTHDSLTLVCKVSNLRYRVLVADPNGLTQADCTPPVPTVLCDPHYSNVSVHQNITTNETTVTIHGKIDYHLNGMWTCRHGTRKGEARTDVTVLSEKVSEINTEKSPEENQKDSNCIRNTLLCTMGGFISAVVITLTIIAFRSPNISTVEGTMKQSKMFCRCIPYHSRNKMGLKRLIFAVLTLILFSLASVGAFFDKNRCIVQWYLLGISIIDGCLSTLIFLARDKYTVETPANIDEITTCTANVREDVEDTSIDESMI